MQSTNAVAGQACTVTSGPNRGKTGTYTVDEEGNLWCEGDWGGTQCDGSKCKDSAAKISIFEYLDDAGQLVYEVDGLVEADKGKVFHVRATIDAASGASRKMAVVPIAATALSDLRESKSKVDRMVAQAVRSHVR